MNEMFSQGGKGSTGILTNKQSVAAVFGVKQSEVVYFSPGVNLGGYKVIYDAASQRAYTLPTGIASGTLAETLSTAGVLVHSTGSIDLGEYASQRKEFHVVTGSFTEGATLNTRNDIITENKLTYTWAGTLPKTVPAGSTIASTGGTGPTAWVSTDGDSLKDELAAPNGYTLLGEVGSYAQLKTIVPTAAGQRIKLSGWHAGIFAGGGEFVSFAGDVPDDGGITARVNASWYWRRQIDNRITPEMFGANGDGSDEGSKLNNFFAASANNRVVGVIRGKRYNSKIQLSIPPYSSIEAYGDAWLDRDPTMDYTIDFIGIGQGSTVRGLSINGNRDVTQATLEVVLVRMGSGVVLNHLTVQGNSGYGIVGNAVNGNEITNVKLSNFSKAGIAFFGDNTSASSNILIRDIRATDLGAGAIYVGNYSFANVEKVFASGTHLGAPGNRMYATTNTSGVVTHSSGQNFSGAKPGMWLVIPGGGECMVTSVSSATSITVSPAPPSNTTVRVLLGTGDMIGIQECINTTVKDCILDSGVTYGTGGGTMQGSSNGCLYCVWENNYIRNFGKNGINVGQSGGDVVSCSIRNNTIVQCGNGGVGTGPSALLPWFDTCGIALTQADAGKMSNMEVSNNRVYTWDGDLNAGEAWFGMSGLSEGSVVCYGNVASGYADGYVRGDIMEVTLTGYGTGATATSFVSTGESIQIAIQTGTTPTASPYFAVRKVIRTRTQPMITAQMITTTGNMAHCWGMQSSTPSLWLVGRNTEPSGIDIYYAKG